MTRAADCSVAACSAGASLPTGRSPMDAVVTSVAEVFMTDVIEGERTRPGLSAFYGIMNLCHITYITCQCYPWFSTFCLETMFECQL